MRKLLPTLAVLITTLSLVGCSTDEVKEPTKAETSSKPVLEEVDVDKMIAHQKALGEFKAEDFTALATKLPVLSKLITPDGSQEPGSSDVRMDEEGKLAADGRYRLIGEADSPDLCTTDYEKKVSIQYSLDPSDATLLSVALVPALDCNFEISDELDIKYINDGSEITMERPRVPQNLNPMYVEVSDVLLSTFKASNG